MAAVSAYSSGREYSSPRTQEKETNQWNFDSPVIQETGPSQITPTSQPIQEQLNFHPHPHQSNGISQTCNRPSTPDRSEQKIPQGTTQGQSKSTANIDPSYLSPYKQGTRPGFNESRSGSEADSLIDLYGHPRSVGERSLGGSSMDRSERPKPQDEYFLDEEDPERSRWIHRDKLAIIESHEMQEAGIKLPPQQLRSVSKSKGRWEHDPRQEAPERPSQDVDMPVAKERKKQRTHSPIRQEEEGEETIMHDFDLRTPEEIAAEHSMESSSTAAYRQPDLRKSSSRIPLPRSSPMPIPQEHIERDTPLPRKRGASGNWTGEENGIAYNKARSRGNSVGSQVLLDDADPSYNTPTPASRRGSESSPTKTRLATNNRPTSGRKGSNTTKASDNQQKPRSTSATSPRTSSAPRPKSRSGLEARPPTAINRPEGEPPWLATMYKPDPRLPPEQQILPTHAKRLQQEELERAQKEAQKRRFDGKGSPQMPREFSPLAEHTVNGLQPSSRDADEKSLQEQRDPEWPLSVGTPGRNPNQRPLGSPLMTDPSQHAGYSTIPRLKEQSPVNQAANSKPLDPFERERMAREEEKDRRDAKKKEEGCGCCIIM